MSVHAFFVRHEPTPGVVFIMAAIFPSTVAAACLHPPTRPITVRAVGILLGLGNSLAILNHIQQGNPPGMMIINGLFLILGVFIFLKAP
ncbi:hypothetical protein Pan216_56330 [Planctomycetes bacterium Pan216]|uniref:Uncharacterized protein n=1 Tax=Kolteria novifilia TaxID=2527975 RepID=A0A518BCM6_9BACT|nr:hypothetical protein Pan216_56330 [Planctomycetes bacterium Pan216]